MSATLRAVRGDTFQYLFALGGGWVGASFTGGVLFTIRQSPPESSVVTDTDAVHQASVANGEIAFDGANGTLTIPASATTTWPTGTLYWDIQGVVAGAVPLVYTLDSGRLLVSPDVTRRTT